MRTYTIYKDEKGKYFASFDDMTNDFPMASGKLVPIKHGKGTFLDMMNERRKAITKEW